MENGRARPTGRGEHSKSAEHAQDRVSRLFDKARKVVNARNVLEAAEVALARHIRADVENGADAIIWGALEIADTLACVGEDEATPGDIYSELMIEAEMASEYMLYPGDCQDAEMRDEHDARLIAIGVAGVFRGRDTEPLDSGAARRALRSAGVLSKADKIAILPQWFHPDTLIEMPYSRRLQLMRGALSGEASSAAKEGVCEPPRITEAPEVQTEPSHEVELELRFMVGVVTPGTEDSAWQAADQQEPQALLPHLSEILHDALQWDQRGWSVLPLTAVSIDTLSEALRDGVETFASLSLNIQLQQAMSLSDGPHTAYIRMADEVIHVRMLDGNGALLAKTQYSIAPWEHRGEALGTVCGLMEMNGIAMRHFRESNA